MHCRRPVSAELGEDDQVNLSNSRKSTGIWTRDFSKYRPDLAHETWQIGSNCYAWALL